MKKYLITVLLLTQTIAIWASPLHSKLKHSIIVDTDCNDSDLRAISILLSNPGITVEAILISGDRIPFEKGIKKIKDILNRFKSDTIPVSRGTGMYSEISLSDMLKASKEEMTIVCLGPLKNIANQLKNNSGIYNKIEEIIWFNESVIPLSGFNYESDSNAINIIYTSGIQFDIISNLDAESSVFDISYTNLCRKSETTLSKALLSINRQAEISEKEGRGEELAALYLENPELFEMAPSDENKKVNINRKYSIKAIREVVTDMITGRYKTGNFVALYGFPVNPELYAYDIRQILEPAISKHGIEEWKACTLTDEFHGHLGVFSIVGAKMGILAREYFGIGTDLIEIKTYAGSIEPFSCMNDGLQVSTGATLGQGSIDLINDSIARPQAIFTFNDQSILIKLKDEYLADIKGVIAKGVQGYGLQDEGYWNLIRQTSIKYWLEWDRNQIFQIEKL